MKKSLLRNEDILLNVEAKDWEDAVKAVGAVMEKQGLVEHRYINSMVNVVRELGPYIVLAPGIALPHARPEDGALATGIGLITLSEPVPFGSADNDPVKIVIGLASKDNTSHIGLLRQLCEFLEDDANVDMLRNATDGDAVAALINEYGKEELE
ncbi:MAG: PTS sugar transporter subunit IIA [Negativicutes bacterium]|nr:PTS sugar transporter subunit IIA [Negativicutes bacterium]